MTNLCHRVTHDVTLASDLEIEALSQGHVSVTGSVTRSVTCDSERPLHLVPNSQDFWLLVTLPVTPRETFLGYRNSRSG